MVEQLEGVLEAKEPEIVIKDGDLRVIALTKEALQAHVDRFEREGFRVKSPVMPWYPSMGCGFCQYMEKDPEANEPEALKKDQ